MSTSSWRDRGRHESGYLRGAHLLAMLWGTCLRHAAWWLGGLRAVLGQWAGSGLRLPQAKAPLTVARLVILFGPEPWQWSSGSFVLRGGSRKVSSRSSH